MRTGSIKYMMGLFFLGLMMISCDWDIIAQTIPDSADKVHPLLVGTQAPDVILKKPDGSNFDLRKSAGERPLILIFYRGGW